jgi:hypothetical protein
MGLLGGGVKGADSKANGRTGKARAPSMVGVDKRRLSWLI